MIDAAAGDGSGLKPDPEPALWRGWFDAARGEAAGEMIREIYDEAGASIAAKGATCWASGKCCHFDSYGHRLYVTGLEVAWVVAGLGERACRVSTTDRGACVLQADGLCSVHTIRPLGCRVFFCQSGAEAWQHALYEQFQGLVRALHTSRGLAYRYMAWPDGLRWALEARAGYLGESGASASSSSG